ncbi:MAG TPA: glycoside hydrolase domain-containing protein [Terracidiphilus sp.]|nr:glycoside hydrolase domain-containing protein [Terracidiphilus sp.]
MTLKYAGMLAALLLIGAASESGAQHAAPRSYLGFDRNDYPGDAALPALRKSFRYTSYWLNNPPGEQRNSWTGKRALLKKNGFGFLVLFNGRTYAKLKGTDATALGTADGKAAAAAAAREGFPANVLIFLDQEEGGRLLPEQAAYLFAWADAVRAGGARAGVYCSGIDVPEGSGTISTAQNIIELESARTAHSSKSKSAERRLKLWIANDQCPPSPGCTLANPMTTGEAFSAALAGSAVVWQYAQSPRRTQFSAGCPANQAPDGKCYAPGHAHSADTFVDLNTADSPDPSEAR